MHLKTVAGAAQRSRDDLHNKLSEVNMELELVNQRNNFLDKQVHSPMQWRAAIYWFLAFPVNSFSSNNSFCRLSIVSRKWATEMNNYSKFEECQLWVVGKF